MRRLLTLMSILSVGLLAPGVASAATGSLKLVTSGAGHVAPVFRATVTLAQSDCDVSGNCEWYAYAVDQPLSQGACPATASTESGPVAPDNLVDLAPQGAPNAGPGVVYSGTTPVTWAFTVAQANIPGPYRVCLYAALPDDTVSNGLVAQAQFTPPHNSGRASAARHGRRVTGTLRASMNNCIGCTWYPSAAEVPASERCPAHEGQVVWSARSAPLTAAGPAQFTYGIPAPKRGVRLCFYLTSTAPRATTLLTSVGVRAG